jgi:hypothetical protein
VKNNIFYAYSGGESRAFCPYEARLIFGNGVYYPGEKP